MGYRSKMSSLHVNLPDELRRFVDQRTSGKEIYSTPSEYVRDLIRRDMQDAKIAMDVLRGLDEIKNKRFSGKSILDFQTRKKKKPQG